MNLQTAIYIFLLFSCVNNVDTKNNTQTKNIVPGAHQTELYFDALIDKNVGLVLNQTSTIGDKHLLDSLITANIKVKTIFTPEHGFRGEADAGALVKDGVDTKTGVQIQSLYGKNKKPSVKQLDSIDVIIFDIQDVGARFYTYISTLHYVMEACAESNIPVILLDRPNPNGHYIDGPVLNSKFESFVGLHPVPVVYGMTIGEYAKMINGESWLANGVQCDLTVVPLKNYDHQTTYDLPIKPSPNLPNHKSILLYPSLCFFEGTDISVGRGTTKQFQQIGHPKLNSYDHHFTPMPRPGANKPKHEKKICFGQDLSENHPDSLFQIKHLQLDYLLEMYQKSEAKQISFFTNEKFFDLLAGTDQFRKDIIAGKTEDEIRNNWQDGLEAFRVKRSKYLLYP